MWWAPKLAESFDSVSLGAELTLFGWSGFVGQERCKMEKSKNKKKERNSMKCKYCGEKEMRSNGASDSSGSIRWKCKNKKCGRTLWVNFGPKNPPIPLAPKFFTGF